MKVEDEVGGEGKAGQVVATEVGGMETEATEVVATEVGEMETEEEEEAREAREEKRGKVVATIPFYSSPQVARFPRTFGFVSR
mmetsp:Transcript_77047/g.152889  ORF Transcript_77047/g.152889 Transcript_77047/m.152889 type:complete len:83 (-) Transcript_77047:518-766(-)